MTIDSPYAPSRGFTLNVLAIFSPSIANRRRFWRHAAAEQPLPLVDVSENVRRVVS